MSRRWEHTRKVSQPVRTCRRSRKVRRRRMDTLWLIFPALSPTCCSAHDARVICATLPEARCAQRGTNEKTARYRNTLTLTNAETANTALRSTKSNRIQHADNPDASIPPADEQSRFHTLSRSQRGYHHFGGSGSILSRMRTLSSITLPTISRLCGLSLSTVSCGVCQKTLL